jgi:hypothetical protein
MGVARFVEAMAGFPVRHASAAPAVVTDLL